MESAPSDVKEAYEGREVRFFELIMGQLIHVGGLQSSRDLADRAGIQPGAHGVDLCCGNGAGMRFLVQLMEVASMVGVELTTTGVERGRRFCQEEGVSDRIRFVQGDACQSGLPDGEADFVWGEDAWCYVPEKEKLLAEAVRLVRPGGTVAFTDWVMGSEGLSGEKLDQFLGTMHFPNVLRIEDYVRVFEEQGCEVVEAEDTGRFQRYFRLYHEMIEMQLTWDALRIAGFAQDVVTAIQAQLAFLSELGRERAVAQARFIVRR